MSGVMGGARGGNYDICASAVEGKSAERDEGMLGFHCSLSVGIQAREQERWSSGKDKAGGDGGGARLPFWARDGGTMHGRGMEGPRRGRTELSGRSGSQSGGVENDIWGRPYGERPSHAEILRVMARGVSQYVCGKRVDMGACASVPQAGFERRR